MTNNLHPDKAVQFKMELGSEVAGQFMNEHAKNMFVPLALLSECVKKRCSKQLGADSFISKLRAHLGDDQSRSGSGT